MLLTSLPLSSLIAYADNNSSGTGTSGGWTVASGELSIWQNNTGVRLYLVDASGGPGNLKVVPFEYGGKQYDLLDIWDPTYKTVSGGDIKERYGVRVGSTSQNLSALTITYETLTKAGLSSPDYVSGGYGNDKWLVNGLGFHNWMASKSPGQKNSNMSCLMYGFMASGNANTYKKFTKSYYLIAEPLVCMPAYADKTYDSSGYRGTVVGTWYDYMRFNNGSNGGWSAAKARSFANGFKLGVTSDDQDYKNFVNNTILKDLGLKTPPLYNGGYTDAAHNNGQYFGGPDKSHRYDYFKNIGDTGWGIQVYWDGANPPSGGSPVDTYDIENIPINEPSFPENPEDTPDVQNSGTKNIIKLYADLYKDPNADGYYTQIVDIKNGSSYAYVRQNVSDKVTITNEEQVNGYKVSAWYTSNTNYTDASLNNEQFRASNMIVQQTDIPDDGAVSLSSLGGTRFKIKNYRAVAGYPSLGIDAGGQKYKIDSTTSKNATQYTSYKRKSGSVVSNYGTYDYSENPEPDGTVVTLGANENTIVILYTREMTHITTDSSDTDITVPDNPDDRIDQSGNLTIVKLYGVLNPSTYTIENEKSVVLKNTTRNVNIKNESGYNFAEWVYTTGGSSTGLTASQMGNPSYYAYDGSADQAYRLDGFVDGFKNNKDLSQYFKFNGSFPSINIISRNGYTSEQVAGRYSIGSRSGIGTRAYNSTIFFGGDGSLADNDPDDKDTNDVLYLLFLKTDQLTYAADDLVIPESYLTRYDNYKQNPMKVNSSISGSTYTEYLQQHKFKYVLPVVTVSDSDYKELNPLLIPHIALKNKTQDGLLLNGATSVQRLDADNTIFKAFTNNYNEGISDYAQLVYIDHGNLITSSDSKTKIGNLLNVSALNLEYTAYRTGDRVTAAMWRHNLTNNISKTQGNSSKLLVTDTDNLIGDFTANNMATKFNPIDAVIEESSATPSTSRQPNNSTQNFKLDFSFGEVGDGVKSIHIVSNKVNQLNSTVNFNGVEQPRTADTPYGKVQLFKYANALQSLRYPDSDTKILGRAECAPLSGDASTYEIHSLRRLYEIKQSDGTWKTAMGNTKYLNAASDINITQNVQYKVHYGSSLANPYKDSVTTNNGTDKDRGQYGYVKSMKAANTISFYPYYTMQYELPSAYNGNLGKNGEVVSTSSFNNANQIYVIGEEKRYLNTYDYAEVSFYGHSVSSSKGTDVVNQRYLLRPQHHRTGFKIIEG